MSRNRLYWILASSGLVGAAVIGAIAMSLLGYGHFDEQKMELTEVHAGLQPILDGLAPKFQEQGRLRALAPMRELSPLHLSQGRSATVTIANETAVLARHSNGALLVYFPELLDGKVHWVCTGAPRSRLPLPCRESNL